jgi:hypothetical protein
MKHTSGDKKTVIYGEAPIAQGRRKPQRRVALHVDLYRRLGVLFLTDQWKTAHARP